MLKFIVVLLLTLHSRQPHLKLGDGCPDQASAPPGSGRCLFAGWLVDPQAVSPWRHSPGGSCPTIITAVAKSLGSCSDGNSNNAAQL